LAIIDPGKKEGRKEGREQGREEGRKRKERKEEKKRKERERNSELSIIKLYPRNQTWYLLHKQINSQSNQSF
jgi:predicted transposase YdaD